LPCWSLNSVPPPWTTPPALFCVGIFQDRVLETIYVGWLWTAILLISASWVARITGVSCQHLAVILNFSIPWQSWTIESFSTIIYLYSCTPLLSLPSAHTLHTPFSSSSLFLSSSLNPTSFYYLISNFHTNNIFPNPYCTI
jgi:hypothetical protein